MNHPNLYNLQQEVYRLFIIGSQAVKADVRLRDQMPTFFPLEKEIPMVHLLMLSLEEMFVEKDKYKTPNQLLDILSRLYTLSYIYTEPVQTSAKRKQRPIQDINRIHTSLSYRQLKPVIDALTIPCTGWETTLEEAIKLHYFDDIRTYSFVNQSFDHHNPDVSIFVEEHIVPLIGQPLWPFLEHHLNYENCYGNSRRFKILYHHSAPAKQQRLIEEAMNGTAPALKATAIEFLSEDPQNVKRIMSFIDNDNRLIRHAVYRAMIKIDTPEILQKLREIYIDIAKNDTCQELQLIAPVIAASSFFFPEILELAICAWEKFNIILPKRNYDIPLQDLLRRFDSHLDAMRNKNIPEIQRFCKQFLQSDTYPLLMASRKRVVEPVAVSINKKILNLIKEIPCES